jgi:hypothetical protein
LHTGQQHTTHHSLPLPHRRTALSTHPRHTPGIGREQGGEEPGGYPCPQTRPRPWCHRPRRQWTRACQRRPIECQKRPIVKSVSSSKAPMDKSLTHIRKTQCLSIFYYAESLYRGLLRMCYRSLCAASSLFFSYRMRCSCECNASAKETHSVKRDPLSAKRDPCNASATQVRALQHASCCVPNAIPATP